MRPEQWIVEGEIGVSSKTMWAVLMDVAHGPQRLDGRHYDIPHDPDDFRRCFKLIIQVGWRARLPEVAECFPAWKPYIERWNDLEKLYIEEHPSGRFPRLYALMQELHEQSMTIDGWDQTGPNHWERIDDPEMKA